MTKKHFEMLAYLIRMNSDSQDRDYLHRMLFVENLSIYLAQINPGFDRARFYKACGLEQ